MKIENLKVGMVLKNYAELCSTLELKPKKGGARQNQLKWIEEHVDFTRAGHKYIVDMIKKNYVEPQQDNRGGANNVIGYIDVLEKLILDLMLQEGNDEKILLSKTQLFQQLSMVNSNYGVGRAYIPEVAELVNVDKKTTVDWYNSLDAMLEGNIVRALKNLAQQSLVTWRTVVTVNVETVIDEKFFVSPDVRYDDSGEKVVTWEKQEYTETEVREATVAEDKDILRIEREVMNLLGCDDKQDVVLKSLWEVFINKVEERLHNETRVNYYYKSYRVIFNQDHIEKRADELGAMILEQSERESHKDYLNTSIQDRALDNAHKRKNNTSISFGVNGSCRTQDSYITDTETLNQFLLDRYKDNLVHEIRAMRRKSRR